MIGAGAGGGILAYRLAMAGEDVLVLCSGKIPKSSESSNPVNELSPEEQGHFGIGPETRFPATPEITHLSTLFPQPDEKSSVPLSKEIFDHYQIHHVNGLQNLWNGISLRYSESDFLNQGSPDNPCQWPIQYKDLEHHYSEVEQLTNVVGNSDHLAMFPDGSFLPPREPRDIDRLFIQRNRSLFGPHLFYFANRKAIHLCENSSHTSEMSEICSHDLHSGRMYRFSTSLLPSIKKRSNFRLREHTRVIKFSSTVTHAPSGKFSVSEVTAVDELTGELIRIRADVVILCAGGIESPRLLLNSFGDDPNKTAQVGLYLQDSPRLIMTSSLLPLWFKPIKEHRGYGDHLLLGGELPSSEEPVPFVAHVWSDFVKLPQYLHTLRLAPRFLKEILARQIYKSAMVLIFQGPSVPSHKNRVSLSNQRDRFSQPQVNIHYTLSEKEMEFIRLSEILGRRLLKNAGGLPPILRLPSFPGAGIHYSGTCRMSKDPDKGVVDENLKFFGATNLYVCDGSVIPVLSKTHPTLTIMALAHRLGDHLIKRYTQSQ